MTPPVPPTPRPYTSSRAAEMEEIAVTNRNDLGVLASVRAEVKYRIDNREHTKKTPNPSALVLLQKIDDLIKSVPAELPRPLATPPAVKMDSPSRVPLAKKMREEVALDENSSPTKPSSKGTTSEPYQQFSPPDKFTLVGPLGTRPRPSAFRPTLKNDVDLDLKKSDSPAKRYRVALAELLREMRKKQIGRQQFALEDGERLPSDTSGYSYQFVFSEDANLFEGAKVEVIVAGQLVIGNITGILNGRIIITVQDDLGDQIKSCILRIDNTAIIQALHDRLDKIETGEITAFRADFAAQVLSNEGEEQLAPAAATWPWKQPPTAQQKKFVEVALANNISWCWGPPGTGKTDTLSALTKVLYDAGKRVLICSNTNQAVDQLLAKLARNMQEHNDPALVDGRVIRLGRIGEDLERDFGPYVAPDLIVARKSEELTARKVQIETELERMGREVSYAQGVLSRFSALDTARAQASKKYEELQKIQVAAQTAQATVETEQARFQTFVAEFQKFTEAGTLKRILLRTEAQIGRDWHHSQARVNAATEAAAAAQQNFATMREQCEENARGLKKMQAGLHGEDRERNQALVAQYEVRRQPLRDELGTIAKQLEDIRAAVLRDAKIVGATITRTFLRPIEFSAFDTVIIDEASMILLPAVFLAVGLATEKVVIAGDFQQLPPIVQTDQQAIHDVLAHDVFAEAGITLSTASKGRNRRLVMLDEQFRMDESICKIVSDLFYDRMLKTSAKRDPKPFEEADILGSRLTIIDTSCIWPFTTRNLFNSRLNLMHALAVRNLVLHLNELGRLRDKDGRPRLGICTPYAAQGKLIREILKSHRLEEGLVRASSVHSYQGDERELMIVDLVDSVGERNAGIFLQANQREDSGAKLLNVALSRAKEGIVILANLTFLDQKLPSDAILRGLLHDIQLKGKVVNVKDVLALHPILDDLKRFGIQPDMDPEALRTGLFPGPDFKKLSRMDMETAKKSIVIFSGFITTDRTAELGDLFRRKINEGVKIRCITRPPNRNGSIPEEQGRAALSSLEAMGVAIDLRNDIHEKVVLVDGKITWFGSLNPLSHTSRTSELMGRFDNVGLATHIASLLAAKRQSAEKMAEGGFTSSENPRCGDCDHWTSLVRGKFGPFFACVSGCSWKRSASATN